jgi:hypothetical protein
MSRGDGEVPWPEAETQSPAALYASLASPSQEGGSIVHLCAHAPRCSSFGARCLRLRPRRCRCLPSFNDGAGFRSRRRPPQSLATPRPSSGPSASVRCWASTGRQPSFLRPRRAERRRSGPSPLQGRPPAA